MLFEASKGDPSFIQVMVGAGEASASQIREMGLLMVTVTSSSSLSSLAPRMVGTTAAGSREGARELTVPTLGLSTLVSSRSAVAACVTQGETEARRSPGRGSRLEVQPGWPRAPALRH